MAGIRGVIARDLLKNGDLRTLFVEELGWNNYRSSHSIERPSASYVAEGLAEKRGMIVYRCRVRRGAFPDYGERVAIESEIRGIAHEHLIVFVNESDELQIWQWVRREAGRPRATREHQYHISQPGDSLIAKLESVSFSLREEEDLTIAQVAERSQAAFDVDTVTRNFYGRFQREKENFQSFIRGFSDKADAEWYAALMLNRLMFVYFIEKRGFLDNDRNYLQNRLQRVRDGAGTETFHTFYRTFLLRLFHDALATPLAGRSADLNELLGNVPYLNGGLFEPHALEIGFGQIDIPDDAFERLFLFFDSYSWHLDDRPLHQDNEINPDVLGYIFEKYINQKEMGAYYTKEDITGYLAGNAVCLSLLNRLQGLPVLGRLREMVVVNPARYSVPNPTVSDGEPEAADAPIMDADIRIDSFSWSTAITHKIDLTVVCEDLVGDADPEELRTIWRALNSLSILDPTCGSGAFLFAALRILQPLYETVVARMEVLLATHGGSEAALEDFRGVLDELHLHPNPAYYSLKCIVLNNLYGVDIMEEAVEICKLRLFLKLASTLEPGTRLEPLPDIDFNIRCGNTVVGYDSANAMKESLLRTLDLGDDYDEIEDACRSVDSAYNSFRLAQELLEGHSLRETKESLVVKLNELRTTLNRHLTSSLNVSESSFENWCERNHPFHWFAEYHEIMEGGGFDVVIGNPPYTEVPKWLSRPYVRSNYSTALERWSRDEDLYTFIVERSLRLLKHGGVFGMVLPLSVSFSTKRSYIALRSELGRAQGRWWFSHFDRIPSSLFGNEVRTRCTIALFASGHPIGAKTETRSTARASNPQVAVTELRRWAQEDRPKLFASLKYATISSLNAAGIPKLGSQVQANAFEALMRAERTLGADLSSSVSFSMLAAMAPNFPRNAVFVGGTAYNWFPVWREIPPTTDGLGRPSLPARTACYTFNSEREADIVFALLGSSLGFWWWAVAGDGFNLKKWLLDRFPISLRDLSPEAQSELAILGSNLRIELAKHYVYKDNRGRIGNWHLPSCFEEIRNIDAAIAAHVEGLTQEFFADIRGFNDRFSTAQSGEAEET